MARPDLRFGARGSGRRRSQRNAIRCASRLLRAGPDFLAVIGSVREPADESLPVGGCATRCAPVRERWPALARVSTRQATALWRERRGGAWFQSAVGANR